MCLQRNVSACLNGDENKVEGGSAGPTIRQLRKQRRTSWETHALRSSRRVLMTDREKRTEDELLRRRKHVKRESDLILVAFALQPLYQIRGV